MNAPVYLDYNATTPVAPEVAAALSAPRRLRRPVPEPAIHSSVPLSFMSFPLLSTYTRL